MVDPGENVSATLKREFIEEALNGKIQHSELEDFFSQGEEIYKGYIDDLRNTDNAWIETVAINFHDEDGGFLAKLNFEAGDDAISVCWVDVSNFLSLYEIIDLSHSELITATVNLRWSMQ